MIAELTLELVGQPIDRRRHVVGLRVGSERLAGDVERCLDPLHPVGTRIMLADELEVDPGGSGLQTLEMCQLVTCRLPHLVGDLQAPAREGQIHARSIAIRRFLLFHSLGRALRRLTWSFPPHPPAGALATGREDRRLPPSPARGAGQDLHLNRAMLSDQGSPYVGRFARGWRRLPGMIPGQPQTRTRARSSIGRSS